VTLPLENINRNGTVDAVALQRNIEALARLVPGLGNQSVEIRFGSGTLTWPGATPFSNTVGTLHGLGRTPIAAAALPLLPSGGAAVLVSYTALDASNITWRGCTPDVAGAAVNPTTGTTRAFLWIAIG
jgi:hypothetical protein